MHPLKLQKMIIFLITIFLSSVSLFSETKQIFISPTGSDSGEGLKQSPVLSIEKAISKANSFYSTNSTIDIEIILLPGKYRINSGLVINHRSQDENSGSLTVKASIPGTVIISGAVPLSLSQNQVSHPGLKEISPEIANKLYAFDLKQSNISGFGPFRLNGFASETIANREVQYRELFYQDIPLQISSWPNNDFATYSQIAENNVDERVQNGIVFDNDQINRWKNESNIILLGYWNHLWAHAYESVDSIDIEKKVLWLKQPYNHYGFKPQRPFKAINLLSEIDQPGEWCYDYKTETIFVYPPKKIGQEDNLNPFNEQDYEISICNSPFISIIDSDGVSIKDIQFEKGTAEAIKITNSRHSDISDCKITGFAKDGILINDCYAIKIVNCEITNMGRGGIIATGGNRATLISSEYLFENCHIYNLSRIDRTYTPAISVQGVGMTIRGCEFHDIPSSALRIDGNDHLIEKNEIYRVVTESDDQGAIDMWGDPTYRGNVYRYNYIHDIQPTVEAGKSIAGRAGIRLDDAISGVKIYGNLFVRSSNGFFGAVQIHGGKENEVYNNIFLDCKAGVSFTPWRKNFWKKYIKNRGALDILKESGTLYQERYPALRKLNRGLNKNRVYRNLFINCEESALRKPPATEINENREIQNKELYQTREEISKFIEVFGQENKMEGDWITRLP